MEIVPTPIETTTLSNQFSEKDDDKMTEEDRDDEIVEGNTDNEIPTLPPVLIDSRIRKIDDQGKTI